MIKVLVIGCGFLGEATADLLFREGWEVGGTCATLQAAAGLSHKPYSVQVCDVSSTESLKNLSGLHPTVVLFCASTKGGDEAAYRNLYLRGVENIREVLCPAKLIFTSSTSVYAQSEGEMVNEESPTEPERPTGKILLEAEKKILSFGGTVARLAGLYGPGRSVLMRKFLSGDAVLEEGGHRWMNQIHRDDAARALMFLIQAPSGIYNVCDDHPTQQKEIYRWLADFFHCPLPPEGPANFQKKRGWTNKRVSNQKLRDLHWKPIRKSYRDAIANLSETVKRAS